MGLLKHSYRLALSLPIFFLMNLMSIIACFFQKQTNCLFLNLFQKISHPKGRLKVLLDARVGLHEPRVRHAQMPIMTSSTHIKQRVAIISKSWFLCVIATLFYSASLARGSWSPTLASNRAFTGTMILCPNGIQS